MLFTNKVKQCCIIVSMHFRMYFVCLLHCTLKENRGDVFMCTIIDASFFKAHLEKKFFLSFESVIEKHWIIFQQYSQCDSQWGWTVANDEHCGQDEWRFLTSKKKQTDSWERHNYTITLNWNPPESVEELITLDLPSFETKKSTCR